MSATQLFAAAALGTAAYRAGRPCTPAHDPALMAMLVGREVGVTPPGEAPTTALLDAWLWAWTAANISQPVTEEKAT